jgi:uroporphyrinogen III methyltransferase/synthase
LAYEAVCRFSVDLGILKSQVYTTEPQSTRSGTLYDPEPFVVPREVAGERLTHEKSPRPMKNRQGIVYLVGAGPGDPGLLTLRGQSCLAKANLILYDYLVNPSLLRHASEQAELVCLGRHGLDQLSPVQRGPGRLLTQQEINSRLVAAAQAGQTVVRLKGGDPAIFGRAAEETAALDAAGVPYVMVPGITTALAAGSYAGIPLTHRDYASCVALVTGQQACPPTDHPEDHPTESPSNPIQQPSLAPAVDFRELAKFPGTLVFYMGVTTAPVWVAALVKHGKSPATPVAVVRHCSLPQQVVLHTSLGNLPELLAAKNIRPPAIIVVGEVARARVQFNWFADRPLFGQRVLVTRPAGQAASLVEQLDALGASVQCQPAIEILPPLDWERVDEVIERIDEFDWCVFSSANGVRFFLDRLLHTGRDLRSLGGVRLATMGPATTQALSEYHLRADFQPADYRAEGMAEVLAADADQRRFLLLRASRGRNVLADSLQAAGGQVEQPVVYRSQDILQADPVIAQALAAGQMDWITVTSSASARSLVALFGEQLRQSKLAAISPLTAEVLTAAGHPPQAVAKEYTGEGMVEAMVRCEEREAVNEE